MWIPERFAVEPVMAAAFRAFRAGAVRGYWMPAVVIIVAIDLLGRLADSLNTLSAFAALTVGDALLEAFLAPFILLTLLRRLQPDSQAKEAARAVDFVDFARMFGLYILVNFAALIGFGFFILPGILIASLLYFADVAIIYRRCGPMDAIQDSLRVGSGLRIQIFVLVLFLIGASLVSDLAFGMIFAEQPVLDIAFDAVVQVPLILYGYIVSVIGYMALLGGSERVEVGDTFT